MRTLVHSLAILGVAAVLTAAAPSAPKSPGDQDEAVALANLRAAQAKVNARTGQDDGFALDATPGAAGVLEAQWAAVRRWTALWLADHPGASPKDLSAAAKSAAGLELDSLKLDSASLLVTAESEALGTAFVLRRGADGRYVTATAFDEPGTWGGGGPPELAAWRSDRASGRCHADRSKAGWAACGPITPAAATRLPDEADGARRFAVVGRYVKEMGATDSYQLSIWRWSGRAAEPLLTYTLAQMADEPVIAGVGSGRLAVREKGEFKRIDTCGACSGRQLEVTFDLPGRGARPAGTRSLVPELDAVDDLYDRMFRSAPTDDLALPAVARALRATVQARRAEAARYRSDPRLGMLMSWQVSHAAGGTNLCLSIDALGASQRFTLAPRGATPLIKAVVVPFASDCSGPGARS